MEKKETHSFIITMERTNDKMEFKTVFDKNQYPELFFDEPSNSGGDDRYPSAVRILTASIMNCLSASLTFCLSKSRIPMQYCKIKTTATTTMARNEKNRLRVKTVQVVIEPIFEVNPDFTNDEFMKKLKRCSTIFEDYCVVTQSVREGISVSTEIKM